MSRIGRFRPLTWLVIAVVKAWRTFISPLYGPVCKYQPSCSSFGLRALQVHGVFRATPMIVWRILRCNPWSHGGYDPVPGTDPGGLLGTDHHAGENDPDPGARPAD